MGLPLIAVVTIWLLTLRLPILRRVLHAEDTMARKVRLTSRSTETRIFRLFQQALALSLWLNPGRQGISLVYQSRYL